MAYEGQEIRAPDGFTLRLVTLTPDLLEMDASYPGTAGFPPEHLHPHQRERFEVLEGTVRAIVAGSERVYGAGESFDVPQGTAHQMAAEGPARVRWQVRPALRTAEFFERLYGSGPGSARELGAAFLTEFADEIRLTP
ncbi:MAG: cupin domain-containing protein [Actinomycetota bacterium]|nr:cupin domain-containing protein [Actinomycetota bacterium]